MEAVLAVAADYANVASDGKLNIMGIFQEVNPPASTFALPQMFLVITWSAGPAEFGSTKDVRIAFMDPDNGENLVLDYELILPKAVRPGTRSLFHQILGIGGLPLFRAGPHAIYVLVGGETKASVPLYVNEPSAPQEGEVLSDG